MSNSPEELFERVLVLRCRTGDVGAFDELVECFQPRLRYYYESIASIVGVPTGTVRSRIHYAKKGLRVILERVRCHE